MIATFPAKVEVAVAEVALKARAVGVVVAMTNPPEFVPKRALLVLKSVRSDVEAFTKFTVEDATREKGEPVSAISVEVAEVV